VTFGGNSFMIFLIINWPNFVYLLVDPEFLYPQKFMWSIAPCSSGSSTLCTVLLFFGFGH